MPGVLKHVMCNLFQYFHIFFTNRTIDHSGLTETTSPDAAPLHFQNHAILCRFHKRYQRFSRIGSLCHIHADLFFYSLWNIFILWRKCLNRSVLLIAYFIQAWHIDARYSCSFMQKFLSGIPFLLALLIQLK